MDTIDRHDELFADVAAIRPPQTDAFALLLRASVRRRLTGAEAEPFRLGRFTVLEPVGGGGMGVVFVAYDPDLDRKIALKVLRSSGAAGQRDVLREGRALARLKHPNVVTVYEVGVLDEHVFVAMEYVQGQNLREWLRQPRSRAEILARLVEAGRGLAAAHAVALIHRDCKPENLVIDGEGHARVIDFGLARPIEELRATLPSVAGTTSTSTSLRAGTPAYMAPERLAGAPGDVRSDQYAFCVTCWEALFGARPPDPDAGRRGPTWVRRALERGLAADPAQRWPSMAALLSALERGRTRRRVRLAVGVLAGIAALGASAAGHRQWDLARQEHARQQDLARRSAACTEAGAAITAVWSEPARQRLRASFAATGLNYADLAADRAMPWLDRQADAWQQARTTACINADEHLGGRWDADLLDRASWCLEERRLEFDALVAEFGRARPTTVEKAVSAAASLSLVTSCLDEHGLRRWPAPPTGDRTEIGAVRAELSRALSLKATANFPEALAVATRARERAAQLDWPPLWAACRAREADLLERTGAYDQAEAAAMDAWFAAVRADSWDVAAAAATDLAYTVGLVQARGAEGRTWARHAEAASVHAGDPLGLAEASRLNALSLIEETQGKLAEALKLQERALELCERAFGPDHPRVAVLLNNLAITREGTAAYTEALALHGRALSINERVMSPDHPAVATNLINLATVHVRIGKVAEARALLERAEKIYTAALGSDHPNVARVLNNLGIVHTQMGAYAEALAVLERALAIDEKSLGPEHPDVAASLDSLATAHGSTGAHTQARTLHERALAIREKALGPEHLDVALSLEGIAMVADATGGRAEARRLRERALAIREKALGGDHPTVASSLNNLATSLEVAGELTAARELYERALAIREQTLAPDHPEIANNLSNLAGVLLAQQRPDDALPLLERAVAIMDATAGVQLTEFAAHFGLARALVASGGDRRRALSAARTARDGLRQAGARGAADLAAVDKWLATHADDR